MVLFQLPKLYPITDRSLTGLSHAEQVRRLGSGGASLVQLREKRLSSKHFYLEAKAALTVARDFGMKLIINDRVDIALAVGADGVHLGQDDLDPEVARRVLGAEAIIGVSTHSVAQASSARSLSVNYLAIGPIFHTNTKSDTEPEVGLAGIHAVRADIGNLPLTAIGGITADNAPQVIGAGANAVALISALLSNPEEISIRTAALLKTLS